MNSKLRNLRDIFLESPTWKTFFSVVLPIAAAVLSGTFIIEINTLFGVEWSDFYKAKSFYGLVALVVVIFLYNRAVFLHEREIRQFNDSDYCIAYMRSKCLPEAAEKLKQRIRDGEGGELEQAMDEFRRILE